MEHSDSFNWKTYELITKYIYENLRQKFNVNIEGFGTSCKVIGNSGVSHQIDVLTSETDGNNTYKTAIECKYWNKKINKDTVMKLWAIMTDSAIKRGIIVSRNGFTKDAQKFADYYHIELIQLREHGKDDHQVQKEVSVLDFDLQSHMVIHRPKIIHLTARTTDKRMIHLSESEEYQIFIEFKNKQKIRLSDANMQFRKDLQNEEPYKIISKSYDYEKCIIHVKDKKEKIDTIIFTGMLTIIEEHQNRTYSVVDQVWLIMKYLFETHTFLISKHGFIVQSI